MNSYFASVHVCAPHACLMSLEVRRECQIPWNQSYRQLWMSMWLQSMRPGSSRRAASSLIHVSLSTAPVSHTYTMESISPHFPSLIPLPLPSYLLHTFPSLFCVWPTEFNYNFLPENGQKVISMSQGDLSVLIRLKKMILPSPTSNNSLVDY